MGKVISVAGMGGAGKTTFSVNLACSLAEREKVVIVLAAELNYGTLQHYFGTVIEQEKGTLASLSDKTEQPEKMLTQCSKVQDNIYLMAIPNDNYEVHTEGLEELKVEQLIRRLSIISDYLIIDCTSDLFNGINIMGIEKSDYVYCLYKSTSSAVLWHRATMPIICQLSDAKIYSIVSEHQLGCEPNAFAKTVDIDVYAFLPNVLSAPIMENIGKPLYYDKDKSSLRYHKALCDISENLINGKENS